MEEKINESAVWSRVSAASRSDGGQRAAPGGDGPVAPELPEAMARERETAQDYRQLARRMGPEGQRVLRQIAAQEQQHSRTLGALYFFLTGQEPQVPALPRQQSRPERVQEALRRQMQSEELTAGWYEALSQRTTGEVQSVLGQIAREERQHFHLLLELLRGSV